MNPCSIKPPANTAACETLPSQIENFTLNFFGEVFKTEVEGVVQWSLPGRLDVGLPLNPRNASEPLGCYLLRLFRDGIVGATGDQGSPGLPGCNGSTPYVQVLAGFTQPKEDVVFSATVSRNPSILPGMDVFIEGSGWYEIVTSDGRGAITVVLRKSVVNPISFVPVGTVLLPSGKIGDRGVQGAQGIQGPQGIPGDKGVTGDQGPQGAPAPAENVALPLSKATIPTYPLNETLPGVPPFTFDFGYQGSIPFSGFQNIVLYPGAVPCAVTLPKVGTYLVLAAVGYGTQPLVVDPNATPPLVFKQAFPGINFFRLKNISTNTIVPQSLVQVGLLGRMITFVSTTTPNNTIQLQAEAIVGAAVITVHYFWAFKIS